MVSPPQPIAIALERGLCRYIHLSIQMTIPSKTGGMPKVYINLPPEEIEGIKVEFPNAPDLSIVRLLVAPPTKDYCWRTFGLVWGELEPAGISLDVVITHGQYGMVIHEDPFIHSLVDEEYPHSLTLTRDKPEIIIIENNTEEPQTIDISIHLVAFSKKEDWDRYQLILSSGTQTYDQSIFIEILDVLKEILKELKEGVRSVLTLWKRRV